MCAKFLLLSFLNFLPCSLIFAGEKIKAYNTTALDIPLNGGAMFSYTRSWRVSKNFDVGWVLAAGQIRREFDLETSNGMKFQTETTAWVLPLTGPVVSLHNNWIGISLGYAAFWADTDIEMKNDTLGALTGSKKAWGSGVYAPLLVLDFYNQKRDFIFGFGLGGYFGTSYPDLVAKNGITEISTNESPINTLTFHLRLLWADGRTDRLNTKEENEEF